MSDPGNVVHRDECGALKRQGQDVRLVVEIEALRSGVLCESVALNCAPKRVRVGDVTSQPGENLPGTWERRGPDGAVTWEERGDRYALLDENEEVVVGWGE